MLEHNSLMHSHVLFHVPLTNAWASNFSHEWKFGQLLWKAHASRDDLPRIPRSNNNFTFSCKTRFWGEKSPCWDRAENIASITDAAEIAARLCNRMFSLRALHSNDNSIGPSSEFPLAKTCTRNQQEEENGKIDDH